MKPSENGKWHLLSCFYRELFGGTAVLTVTNFEDFMGRCRVSRQFVEGQEEFPEFLQPRS